MRPIVLIAITVLTRFAFACNSQLRRMALAVHLHGRLFSFAYLGRDAGIGVLPLFATVQIIMLGRAGTGRGAADLGAALARI
jgi:hypothetical protein